MNKLHLYVFRMKNDPIVVGVEAYSIEQAYQEALIWDPDNWELMYCKMLMIQGGEGKVVF